MQEAQVPSLDQEDPLEKGMATYSSILRTSLVAQMVKKKKNLPAVQNSMGRGARELQSVGLQRAGHD